MYIARFIGERKRLAKSIVRPRTVNQRGHSLLDRRRRVDRRGYSLLDRRRRVDRRGYSLLDQDRRALPLSRAVLPRLGRPMRVAEKLHAFGTGTSTALPSPTPQPPFARMI